MWQDYLITFVQFAFGFALIPAVLAKEKPDFISSVANTLLCFILASTFLTLNLLVSGISAYITGLIWAVLAVQKYLK